MVCEPTVMMMGTVVVATFKNMCDYIPAATIVKGTTMLVWAYSLIPVLQPPLQNLLWAHSLKSGLRPPLIKVFTTGKWAYTAIFYSQPPLKQVARDLKVSYLPI